jgi:hypothetical protein
MTNDTPVVEWDILLDGNVEDVLTYTPDTTAAKIYQQLVDAGYSISITIRRSFS